MPRVWRRPWGVPMVAELAARAHTRIAYVLFIEGIPWAFTDEQQLVGGGNEDFTWIGQTHGDRQVILGLKVPDYITYSVNLQTGMFSTDDSATFGLTDFEFAGSNLIRLLQEIDPENVSQRLGPKDDPAPSTLLDTGNPANDLEVWNKWVNQEAIGQFGERRRFQVFPSDPLPGYDHAAISGIPANPMAPSAVYDVPTFFRGRLCALYRLYKDVTNPAESYTAWPSWTAQFESGQALVWWGTLDEVSAESKEWKLRCRGPSSWLRKMLNSNRAAEWSAINTTLTLDTTPGQREDLICIDSYYKNFVGVKHQAQYSQYLDPEDVLPTSGYYQDYIGAINSRLQVVLADVGEEISWTNEEGAEATFEPFGVTVSIDPAADPATEFCAIFRLTMHDKVWRFIGYDPKVQPTAAHDQTTWIQFVSGDENVISGNKVDPPAAGYWTAIFHTLPLGMTTPEEAGPDCDNNGNKRLFVPLLNNPGGVNMLWPTAKQQVAVGDNQVPPYNEGQLNRPPANFTFDIDDFTGLCDRSGYLAFRGKYRNNIDEEPRDMVQLAKVSWRNDDASNGETFAGGSNRRWAYIEKWLDPRNFGINNPPLKEVWSSAEGDLEFVPFAYLGYRVDNAADRADMVLLRTLLSTGTASWEGFEGEDPVRTLGTNAHPDAVYDEGSDVEIADLGLGIYHELIDWRSFTAAAADLPGGPSGPFNRCKVGVIGPLDSQELISRIITPRGWAIGLKRGKYTCWSMPAKLELDDVEVELSPTDFDSRDLPFVEQVTLTPTSPIDKWTITYGDSMTGTVGADAELALSGRSTDRGAPIRHTNVERQIDGQGLVPTDLWPGGEKPPTWQGDARKRWSQICEWRAQPHVMIVGLPVRPSKAKDLHVGTVVSLSTQWCATRDGHYGLTGKLGRVVKVQRALQPGPTKVDILVQAGDPTLTRRFAPHAWARDMVSNVEDRYDSAARKILCYRDAMGAGLAADKYDTKYFVEPGWSTIGGGNALVHGWQHDGREWAKTFEFKAESVGQNTGACWVVWEAGTFSGKFWEARYTLLLLAPYDDQPAAWAKQIFLVNTRPDHLFGAGPTKGWKFV